MSEKEAKQETFPELNAKLRLILEKDHGHKDQSSIYRWRHGFDVWDVHNMLDLPVYSGEKSKRINDSIMFVSWVILKELSEQGFIIPVFPNKIRWPKKNEPWLYGGEFFMTAISLEKPKEI